MKKIYNNINKVLVAMLMLPLFGGMLFTSCSDEPDDSNYYTFTGQMMSDYLKSNENFSKFATIVERAGLMDQLSAYGHYTLFLPDNAAVDAYLAEKGISSLDALSNADCDTIARTHLMDEIYSTADMHGSMLPTKNMMRRNINIADTTDADKQATVILNYSAFIKFNHKNDSVENGIVQQISSVLDNNTRTIAYYLSIDENIKIFAAAIHATGLDVALDSVEDQAYKKYYEAHYKSKPSEMIKTGSRIEEAVWWPEEKLYGYTVFAVPDQVLASKGITDIKGLYDYACQVYDQSYDNDDRFSKDSGEDSHSFENITNPNNPLYRLLAYHILDRNVQSYDYLTVRENAGIDTRIVNPTEWYSTLLPHTMVKVEKLYTEESRGRTGVKEDYYLNRRYDESNSIDGAHVSMSTYKGTWPTNGIYFYVDDILAFDGNARKVHNTRIRMDFSTIFPEVMNNGMRMNGPNITGSNVGKNYRFPDGYLNGVEYYNSDMRFIYWYPNSGYYSMNGDEFDAQRYFDMAFNLPPVPSTGYYQLRLGFAPMSQQQGASRGQVQVYFGAQGESMTAQGIPLNMAEPINEQSVYGTAKFPTYSDIRNDSIAKQTDFKLLKNKGYYRGPYSVFNGSDGTINGKSNSFADMASTVRKVLCTVYMEAGKTYKLRIKNVSTSLPMNKEAMFDYLEIVPKSVYGVSEGGRAEDDL